MWPKTFWEKKKLAQGTSIMRTQQKMTSYSLLDHAACDLAHQKKKKKKKEKKRKKKKRKETHAANLIL